MKKLKYCGYECSTCPYKIDKNCKIYSFYCRRKGEVDKVLLETDWNISELNDLLYQLLYQNKCLNEIIFSNNSNKNLDNIIFLLDNFLNINNKSISMKCSYCGSSIRISLARYKLYDKIYCSNECRYNAMREDESLFKSFDVNKLNSLCDNAGLIYVDIDRRNQREKSRVSYICKKHKNKGIQSCMLQSLRLMAKRKRCSCHLLNFTKEDLINDARRDKSYEILGEYINNSTPILCKCNICHKEFEMIPNKMLIGRKCPKCYATIGEREISKFLDEMGIEYIEQCVLDKCKYINSLEYDFYIPEYNYVIEYMGKQHYELVTFGASKEDALKNFKNGQIRDNIKRDYCKKHNIRFIEIPYWEYKNIKNILSELFY